MRGIGFLLITVVAATAVADDKPSLRKSLIFHASFDRSTDADLASGDRKIYTAESLKRQKVKSGLATEGAQLVKSAGKYAGSLRFTKKSPKIVFFKGGKNVPFDKEGYGGSISFWLKLSPDDDLPPGFVDPLQITDKKWNDASMFVDFSKDKPRQFRLGVFSDYKFWNPQDRKWDTIAEKERPLVTAKSPPFDRSRWTNVIITYDRFNSADDPARASLYLDGKLQGDLKRPQRFSWNRPNVVIMLGIGYVGGMDDLAIFNRTLSMQEIKTIQLLKNGIKSLD